MKKQMKHVVLYGEKQYGEGWPSHKLTEAVSWFQKKLSSIPAEFRDSATLEIDTEYDDYSDNKVVFIQIAYERPETDAEQAERLQTDTKAKDRQRERDLKMLAELKAKYGDG